MPIPVRSGPCPRPPRARAWTALAGVLVAAAALSAAAAPEDRRPIRTEIEERVEVRVREIPIVAVRDDLSGVVDLRPGDLEVRAGGEVVAVGYLDRELARAATAGPLPAVRLFVKVGDGYETAVTREEAPRHFLVLVDVENSHPIRFEQSRDGIAEFVRERLPASARVAVLGFNGELTLECPFTDDRAAAVAAVGAAFDRPRRAIEDPEPRLRALIRQAEGCEELNDVGTPTGQPDLPCLSAIVVDYRSQAMQRAGRFLGALAGTVEIASGLADRPTVIAYTHGAAADAGPEIADVLRAVWGFSANPVLDELPGEADARKALDEITDVAAARGVVLHVIDPSPAPPPFGGARTQVATAIPGVEPFETAFRASQRDLTHVAENTAGGIWTETDVAGALDRVLSYEEGRYVLGVTLPTTRRGGVPDVEVRSKRGGVRIVKGRVLDAGPDPGDTIDGQIGLADAQPTADAGRFLRPFRLGFRTEELDFARDGDRFEASLTLHLVVQTSSGRYVTGGYYAMTLAVPAEAGGLPARIVSVQGGLEAPAGDYRIVAVVRNPRTGSGGRLTREVAVEPPP